MLCHMNSPILSSFGGRKGLIYPDSKNITCSFSRFRNFDFENFISSSKFCSFSLAMVVLRQSMKSSLESLFWFEKSWLCSNAAFFYQGNSNSIASIDVNAGYIGPIGLSSYNEILVGLLIFCNTFSLPILVILAYFESTGLGRSYADEVIPSFFTILAKTNSATVYHLFIWSVFAPKLL